MYKSLSFNPVERQTVTYLYTFLHNAFTEEECDRALELCKTYELEPGKIGIQKKGKSNAAIRKSNVSHFRIDEKNFWLFEKIANIVTKMNEQFYNFNLNGFEFIQFTEYNGKEKGHYDWHIDCRLSKSEEIIYATRKLSVSILLNDDFKGGELCFHHGNVKKQEVSDAKKGSAIVFPSFVPHRVAPVTDGTRYSLVVWVEGPKFI